MVHYIFRWPQLIIDNLTFNFFILKKKLPNKNSQRFGITHMEEVLIFMKLWYGIDELLRFYILCEINFFAFLFYLFFKTMFFLVLFYLFIFNLCSHSRFSCLFVAFIVVNIINLINVCGTKLCVTYHIQ